MIAPHLGPHIAVVGAGAFGGWTALHLLRRGARVTLLDAWGPGNSRSSSGGETRIIRGAYGPDRLYVDWTARSFGMWREAERRWGRRLYRRTGVLWMGGEDDGYVRASLPLPERRRAWRSRRPPRQRRGRVSRRSISREFVPSSSSRRRGICSPAAPARRWRRGWRPREGRCGSRRPSRTGSGRQPGAAAARRRLGAPGGPLPLRLRPLARRALSGGDRRPAPPRDPAGGLLLRHAARGPLVPRGPLPDLGGPQRGADLLRHAGQRAPRLQGGGRHPGSPLRSHARRAARHPGPPGRGAGGPGPPLPRPGGRAGRRDPSLPVREQPGRPPPLRPPPARPATSGSSAAAPATASSSPPPSATTPREILLDGRHPRSPLPPRPPRPRRRGDPDAVRALRRVLP